MRSFLARPLTRAAVGVPVPRHARTFLTAAAYNLAKKQVRPLTTGSRRSLATPLAGVLSWPQRDARGGRHAATSQTHRPHPCLGTADPPPLVRCTARPRAPIPPRPAPSPRRCPR